MAFTVVAAFLLGTGGGALLSGRISRPWRVEVVLGFYHLVWALFLSSFLAFDAALLRAAAAAGVPPEPAAAAIGFVWALVPAVMLGVTFPALVEGTGRPGLVYALQALGALGGILTIQLVVYPAAGLPRALLVLAVGHGVTAALMRPLRGRLQALRLGRPAALLVVVGAFTGGVQGTWLFLAELLFRPLFFVQSFVVALFLTGLTLGAALEERARLAFRTVLGGCAVGVAGSGWLAVVWLDRTATADPVGVGLQLALLILPAAVPIGALFPAWMLNRPPDRRVTGSAMASLALGNTIGLLISGAVLLRTLLATSALALLAAGLALVFLVGARGGRPRSFRGASVPLLVGAFAMVASGVGVVDFLGRLAPRAEMEVMESFRAPAELTAVFRWNGDRRLYQSGYSPIDLDRGLESAIAAVGLSYAPRFDRALVVGAGSGRTAGTVARVVGRVDVVDIGATVEPLVRSLRADNFGLLDREGVRFHRADGVLAPLWLEGGYDLVVLTVDPGYLQKAAKLYYRESLERFGGLLAPGGILVFWGDHELGRDGAQVLVNTGAAVFPHQKLWSFQNSYGGIGYFFLVHGRQPLSWRPDRADLQVLSDGDRVAARVLAASEYERLLAGPIHPTRAVHSLDRPSLHVLFAPAGR